MINLYIPVLTAGDEDDKQEREDIFNSGEHLITEIMWDLKPEEMTTNITCMKDTCLKQIDTHFAKEKIKYIETEGNG